MTTTQDKTGRTILLGISGGIAAYKAVEVASRLAQDGATTQVVMTAAAQEFVTPLTFSAVTGRAAITRMFPGGEATQREELYPHLYPATRTDLCVLLPATANLIARVAHGLGDDVLTTGVLSLPATCIRMFCPAMNVDMWNAPVVQENVAMLEGRGWIRIGPESGKLACGTVGAGRMAEPAAILAAIDRALARASDLSGRRFLILSGPTREYLDSVRFISNGSSGRMGQAVAEAALARGAAVDFVTGPVAAERLPRGAGVRVTQVVSAADMLAAGEQLAPAADAMIFAAAVADYAPRERSAEKHAKAEALSMTLAATADIAATLSRTKRAGQVAIGFALQTGDGAAAAQTKLVAKGLDGIVLNDVASVDAASAGFRFFAAGDAGSHESAGADWGCITKQACADNILDEVQRVWASRPDG